MTVHNASGSAAVVDLVRPARADDRRALVLQAAAEIFFENGYAATSVDSIIEKTGGSKRTIYNEFGSKEGLFKCLVTESTVESASILDEELPEGDLEEKLLEVGRRIMTSQMSPRILGVYRAMMTESQRFPDLAEMFYEKGAGSASAVVMSLLQQAKADGHIEVKDCRKAADIFIGMLRNNVHLEVVLQLRAPLTPREMKSWVANAVAIFLAGVRTTR